MMVDFKKYPHGKDRENETGIELNGEYYSNLDILIALAKTLVKKGVLTKAEIVAELT